MSTSIKTLKVLTFNIHKGFSPTNQEFTLTRIRALIRASGADLVFLQEVLGHHENQKCKIPLWKNAAQFEYLADQIWTHFAYGRNAVYQSGHHGNAILSRYPIKTWENIDISTNRLEKRGILHAVLDIPGQKQEIHTLCLHLNLLAKSRRTQVRKLIQRIRSQVPESSPLLIGGDFNDWREELTPMLLDGINVQEAHFALHGQHARTFPTWLPILPLDRIYFRGVAPVETKRLYRKPWSELSDHVPLTAEFALNPAEDPGL